jgi:hypothetical protein
MNAAAKAAHVRPDRMQAARSLIELGLRDFEQGAGALGERSALVRDGVSAPGWSIAEEYAAAARKSLGSGAVLVPRVTPAIHADLAAFFASPPDPAAISVPLLRSSVDPCGSTDCDVDIEIEPAYAEAFFADIDADFDGDYTFADDDALQRAVRQVLLKLDASGSILGR